MKLRILAVCPYKALRDLVQLVASQRSDVLIDTILGDISDGESLKERVHAMQDNYDLLLSRGQTLRYLSDCVNIPTMELSSGPFDIMRIVRLIKNYPGKCVLVGSSNVREISRQICELMNANIDTVASDSNDDIYKNLQQMREEGYTLVIGGMTGVRIARSLGMNSILITTGREAITTTLDNAVFLHNQLQKNSLEAHLLHSLVNADRCFTVVFDDKRHPIYQSFNQFSLPISSVAKKLDALFQYGELSTHIRVGNNVHIFSGRICEVDHRSYALVRVFPCYYIEPKKQSWITAQSADDQAEPISLITATQNPALMRQLEQLDAYVLSQRPVIVHGETGVGKEAIVKRLHSMSRNHNSDLITIDISAGTRKSWESLLNHPNSPLNRMDCNIFFKNIQDIPDYICEPFEDYLRAIAANESIRLYFSWTTSTEAPMEEHPFWRFMVEEERALSIWMPPLRERTEDFPNLVALAISDCNAQLGTQVFGIEDAAMPLLQQYAWPYNFIQFQQFIRDAAIRNYDSRITVEVVQDQLAHLPKVSRTDVPMRINLDRNLAEITEEIIQYALREENYNYSRTAARLGISRSSLWRKMRQ